MQPPIAVPSVSLELEKKTKFLIGEIAARQIGFFNGHIILDVQRPTKITCKCRRCKRNPGEYRITMKSPKNAKHFSLYYCRMCYGVMRDDADGYFHRKVGLAFPVLYVEDGADQAKLDAEKFKEKAQRPEKGIEMLGDILGGQN
jgi:hypothetical protein